MAQKSNKSRIIIWTIVGVLVVIAVVMLVTRPKNIGTGVRDISTDDIPGYITRYNSHMDKFNRRVSEAVEDYGHDEMIGEIEVKMDFIRQGLVDLEGLTEPEEIKAQMDTIDATYKQARELLSDFKRGE